MKHIGMLAVLVFAIACSSEQPQSEQDPGSIQAKITLPSGATITQVSYTLTCSPTPVPASEATGTWVIIADSTGQGRAEGAIGGLDPSSTCTLTLLAQDSWGATHGNIQNCQGKAEGVVPGGNVNLNLVCYDFDATASNSGSISANVTVSEGAPYQCSGIAGYTSAAAMIDATLVYGYGFYLNASVTNPTAPQTVTWTSTDANAFWLQPLKSTFGSTFVLTGGAGDPALSGVPAAQYMVCQAQGSFTITLTVQDNTQGLVINGVPGTCPPSVDTFAVTCF